jgi:inorganic pyrophosphatase
MVHPWHEVPTGNNVPQFVNSIIEIPKGSRAKYELDKETGLLRLDRVLYSSMYYPANYGLIPQTYADDSDPLDILVLSQINFDTLCIVNAKPIGVMRMLDSGEADDKIIAVAAEDISINHMNDISELPAHFLREITNFFEDYKKLENKTVRVDAMQGRELALEIIQYSVQLYDQTFRKK